MKRFISWVLILAALLGCFAMCAAAEEVAAVAPMRTTEAGIQFIKSQEGFSARRWWDISQYSIGYGTACSAGAYPNGITVEEADKLLRERLLELEDNLNKYIEKHNLSLSAAQYDALISFTYNVGSSWMRSSRISTLLTSGMFTEIEFASALGVWCHAGKKIYKGLVLRRIREVQLFLYGDYAGTNSKKYYYVIFDANGGNMDADIYFYPEGNAYGPLQTATKKDQDFAGWFTDSGVQLTETSVATQNLSVNAQWRMPKPEGQAFYDVPKSAWFYSYVDQLHSGGVINGYSDGTFRPTGSVTVAEALKLILIACGSSELSPTDTHWASGYRSAVLSGNYLTAEETAELDKPISRSLIAKLTAGIMGISAEPQEGVFADTTDGSVIALKNAGVITGTPGADGSLYFYPNDCITRAELSAIVCRIRNRA